MNTTAVRQIFDEHKVLHDLKHYLPAQAPLKDFVHHNTFHAYQELKFQDALRQASEVFGYKSSLSLDEYRKLYSEGKIDSVVLRNVLLARKGNDSKKAWFKNVLEKQYDSQRTQRVGALRSLWKQKYQLDMDSMVHPTLFRLLCSYLDQGISIWKFPINENGFLASIIDMEKNSYVSIFKTKSTRKLFLEDSLLIEDLLAKLVGDESLYERYLFDQQFAHQGWSGIVSSIENDSNSLLDKRSISLHELIVLECWLELDVLEQKFDDNWQPLGTHGFSGVSLFEPFKKCEEYEVLALWQEAFEWTFYDQVLKGIQSNKTAPKAKSAVSFQAMFCIDDRECSYRRYLEQIDNSCETIGTPGFFGVEFFYQPINGQHLTKVCPAPVTPKYLIKEVGEIKRQEKDVHFSKHSHSFYSGWLISQTLGFWSAIRLFFNIFKPSMSPAVSHSFQHMDKFSSLTIEHIPGNMEKGLQVGFTIAEMTDRVEGVLRSTCLIENFAPIVYSIGHGASTINNPHYAAYDCGACCGRAGSVNARVFAAMANHPQVRTNLAVRGIIIPDATQFVGGLRDTTRDEVVFFDEDKLNDENTLLHQENLQKFYKASDLNAKERSRRFESIDTSKSPARIHDQVIIRSVSLFEPRPELNHATNSLCIVGRRELSRGLFLDRRSFMNSYNYALDPQGEYLLRILNAAAPVCGGINLEYYFSRVDNQKLGAGSKLPHNVMGLVGVANGIDGDLRPGLPSQMIEVHDPIRLLMIIEHFPEVVLETIKRNPATYEWFINEWVVLSVVHPLSRHVYRYDNGGFYLYQPSGETTKVVTDFDALIEKNLENLPISLLAV
ncbi:hypothetical protein SAMN06298216_3886 [Spirosomataceae bacterium TFI 002]|nr:hypothetical protein SAMN06298216_3886 [Spirosomataceae bacterium TFI 002]